MTVCVCAWYMYVCYGVMDVCIVYAGIYVHAICTCVHLSVKVCSLYAHMEARVYTRSFLYYFSP